MATPLSTTRALQQLKAFGVNVTTHGDWAHHNRKGMWGPVHGVMIHHTVTRGTESSLNIVTNGYSGLPGPLCHGLIDKLGTVHLVGWGRANHAGLGDAAVLRAVASESALPKPKFQTTDGNSRFYGFECVNMGDGEDPWPEVQITAIVRAAAALCEAHGWSERSVIGHKEWQTGKIDPCGFSMDTLRGRIAAELRKEPPTGPVWPVIDLSLLVAAAKSGPKVPGTPVSYAGTKTVELALVAEGYLNKSLADGHYGTATVAAYKKWQKECGYTGDDADGIPGVTTLRRLGARHGFDVKA